MKNIIDLNSCETPLSQAPAKIEIFTHRPSAIFHTERDYSIQGPMDGEVQLIYMIEGHSVKLPIYLTGMG